jgi:hypothetical protein
VTKITGSSSGDWIYWHFGYSYFNYNQYNTLADLHTLQFTVAHTLGLSVPSSRLLVTDLNTETITSNHYEVFFPSVTLNSSVLICTKLIFTIAKDMLHPRPCTLNCAALHYSKLEVTLRLAVYRQSVCLGVEPLENHDQNFFPLTEPLRY